MLRLDTVRSIGEGMNVAKCKAYTLYRDIDRDTRIVRGEGETPADALAAAAEAGYPECAMLIDGKLAYEDGGRWYLSDNEE